MLNSSVVVIVCIKTREEPMFNKKVLPDKRHKDNQFVSITVSKAIILFKSTWPKRRIVPSIIPIVANDEKKKDTRQSLFWINLTRPITPNLTKKPLKNIENSVEAST